MTNQWKKKYFDKANSVVAIAGTPGGSIPWWFITVFITKHTWPFLFIYVFLYYRVHTSQGCSWTSFSLASTSKVLRLQGCNITPSLCGVEDWTQGLKHCKQTLSTDLHSLVPISLLDSDQSSRSPERDLETMCIHHSRNYPRCVNVSPLA